MNLQANTGRGDTTWLNSVRQPSDRGTLHSVHQKVRIDRFSEKDQFQHGRALPVGSDTELDIHFEQTVKYRSLLSPRNDNFLMFRSRQLNDNDRMWIESVERDGDLFTVVAQRAIWTADYAKNITFYDVFAINLGRLPEGKYRAKWIIKPLEHGLTDEVDAEGRPKIEQPSESEKQTELSATFTIAADHRQIAPKRSKPNKLNETAQDAPDPLAPAPRTPNPRTPNPRTPNPRTPAPRAPAPLSPDPLSPAPRTPDPRAPEFRSQTAPAKGDLSQFLSDDADSPANKFVAKFLKDTGGGSTNLLIRMDAEQKAEMLPAFIAALGDQDIAVRRRALRALRYIGPAAKDAVPELILMLQDENRALHSEVTFALGGIGTAAKAAVPALLEALKNEGIGGYALGDIRASAETVVPALIVALQTSTSRHTRIACVHGLAGFPMQGKLIIPAFAEALKDGNKGSPADAFGPGQDLDVRSHVAGAVAQFGPAAELAVPALMELLSEKNPRLQNSVVRALGIISPKNEVVVRNIAKLLSSTEVNLRYAAVEALARIDPLPDEATNALLATLNDTPNSLATRAAEILAKSPGSANKAVAVLKETAKHKSSLERLRVAECLGQFRPHAALAVPVLTPLLRDQDVDVQTAAATAVGRIRLATRAAVSQLVFVLEGDNLAASLAASWALGSAEFKNDSSRLKAKEALVRALENDEADIQDAAAMALVQGYFTGNQVATPILIRILKRGVTTTKRSNAAWALGTVWREPSRETIMALLLALKDQEKDPKYASHVPSGAAEALCQVGIIDRAKKELLIKAVRDTKDDTISSMLEALKSAGPIDIPTLIANLNSKTSAITKRAVGILTLHGESGIQALIQAMTEHNENGPPARSVASALGTIGKSAVPVLIKAMSDEMTVVRTNAAYALAKIGPDAHPAVDILIAALKDEDANLRAIASQALGRIGPAAKPAVSSLIELLDDKNRQVYTSSTRALGRIGAVDDRVVPAIVKRLADERANARSAAAFALGNIGLEAKAAIPQLIELLKKDEDAFVRTGSASALKAMGPAAIDALPTLRLAVENDHKDVKFWAQKAIDEMLFQ
ncbi:MAG: HEAT repeat protein [Pirellulaceae bacterium]|jgi:HEAT repeat protein